MLSALGLDTHSLYLYLEQIHQDQRLGPRMQVFLGERGSWGGGGGGGSQGNEEATTLSSSGNRTQSLSSFSLCLQQLVPKTHSRSVTRIQRIKFVFVHHKAVLKRVFE